jgi:hypothetical protein
MMHYLNRREILIVGLNHRSLYSRSLFIVSGSELGLPKQYRTIVAEYCSAKYFAYRGRFLGLVAI